VTETQLFQRALAYWMPHSDLGRIVAKILPSTGSCLINHRVPTCSPAKQSHSSGILHHPTNDLLCTLEHYYYLCLLLDALLQKLPTCSLRRTLPLVEGPTARVVILGRYR
jgi:hypothetical protein